MTSFRQIEANRRNAIRSTGPSTEEGKRRSRRNAVRHGLCAETVVETVEDIEDYSAFEAAVIADYDAQTAVERELVLRLASLLWRLRRATSIETDCFGSRPRYCAIGGSKRGRRASRRRPFALSKPRSRFPINPRMVATTVSSGGPTIKLLLPFPSTRRDTSHQEI